MRGGNGNGGGGAKGERNERKKPPKKGRTYGTQEGFFGFSNGWLIVLLLPSLIPPKKPEAKICEATGKDLCLKRQQKEKKTKKDPI